MSLDSSNLKPLAKNEYKINDCQEFPDMLKDLPPLKDNGEYVVFNVNSLFTNIPLKDTIEYVIHKIYDEKVCNQYTRKILSDDYCTNQITNQHFNLIFHFQNKLMAALWVDHCW